MPNRRSLAAVAVALLTAAAAAGGGFDPALLGALHWRMLGPFRGGRVLAVAGVPGEPSHFYFGSVNGGVWETTDAGRTWRPIFDSQPVGSIGALAIAPSRPKTIYVGTGEADMRSDIAQGEGVWKSTDGGRSWSFLGLADTQQIGAIIVDPRNPDVALVAALGHPYGPNAERGVFRTEDGGKIWTKTLFRDADTGAIDLAFEPSAPDVVYAALWHARRTPWNVYPPASGPGGGIYRSTDNGRTWSAVAGQGLPRNPGRIGLAVAPSAPRRLYAMVDAEAGGLFRSDDAGATWTRTADDPRIWGRGWYFGGVTVDPRNADLVFACNTAMYASADAGKTFTPVKGAPGGDDYHALWIDPTNSDRRIVGADQGAVVTLNGGRTWSSWYNQPTAQFYRVATDRRFPYWVYGAQQDSGAAAVPSRGDSVDGINMTHFHEVTAGGENGNIAPDPLDPQIVFGGEVDRLDLRTGQTQSIDPTIAEPDFYRRTWTLPLVFSRRDPRVLYFSHQQLYRTDDAGRTWRTISPDLTREDPGVPPNLDPSAAAVHQGLGPRRGVIYSIAPSRLADGDLWVGTDDGLVWRTRDEGGHWENVTPPALTPWSKVTMIETSPFDAETAYLAVDRHRLEDRRPYVYRTRDGGRHWDLAVAGIAADHFLNSLRADPARRGLLYAATEKGVWVSFDDGDAWQPLQLDLPVTSVRDLEVHDDDLVIATHGRGFWVLDDLASLRQLDAGVAAAPVWLFAPTPARRVRPGGFTGTPLPKDEPRAPNPPDGAAIDYRLAAAAKAAVTLEIRDGEGGLVRRYSSADKLPDVDLARRVTSPEWFVPPVALSAAPGTHRMVWPLRFASQVRRDEPFADGIWAPPGRYTVTLEVDGVKLTQPLEVLPDPRIDLPAAAYRESFALARDAEALRARLAPEHKRAADLRQAAARTRAGAAAASRASHAAASALDRLIARLDQLVGGEPPANPKNDWFPARQIASFRFVDGALDDLVRALDGADAQPTKAAKQGLANLAPLVDQVLAAWQDARARELAATNRALAAAKLPALDR
ncbi:MAG: hypothetical protein U0X73_01295 [Thermoanaerobaculia bacterium]